MSRMRSSAGQHHDRMHTRDMAQAVTTNGGLRPPCHWKRSPPQDAPRAPAAQRIDKAMPCCRARPGGLAAIYASYFLTFTGYVLSQTSMWNAVIYAASITLMLIRIFHEERRLSMDPSYRDYMTKVPYRLIPLVF